MREPLMRRRTCLVVKMSCEATWRHPYVCRQPIDRQVAIEVRLDPLDQPSHTARLAATYRHGNVLRLTAVAVRRNDEPFRDRVRDLGAEVVSDDVQA